MRLLFAARALTIGGAERQLVVLARGLAARGHVVGVALFYPGGPFEPELASSGVEVLSLARRSRWDPALAWRWPNLIRSWRPDIVHGYLTVPNLVSLSARLVARPKVVWGVRSSQMEIERYDAAHRYTEALGRMLINAPDLIITNSRAGARDIRALGRPAATIAMIPNGIDTERFVPDPFARSVIRTQWGLPPNAIAVGIVGRLDPMKDHATFLSAAARLAAQEPRLTFIIVGEGLERDTICATIASLGLASRVRLQAPLSNPERLYPGLDLLVSSSAFGEGFSNVLAEGMACGIPVVATAVGDAASIIDDPVALVPPRDPVALAQAITARLARPRGDVRSRIRQHFSIEALVSRTEAVLASLSERRSVNLAGDCGQP